jgi:Flp pilus assembly CpaF family ATPase
MALTDDLRNRLRTAREDALKQATRPFDDPTSERAWATSLVDTWIDEENQRRISAGNTPYSSADIERFSTTVLDNVYGLGIIDEILRDDRIADVHIFGYDRCMVRLTDGMMRRWEGPVAISDDDLIRLVQVAASRHGGNLERRFDSTNLELNMQLKDGSRLFAVRDVTDSPHVVIRRHHDDLMDLPGLVGTGMLTEPVAHLLDCMVKGRLNGVVSGSTSSGKAHPLDERIPTPDGWTTIGDLQVGDEVFGSDGRPIKVLGLSDVRTEQVCTVTLTDGRTVRTSPDHLWEVSSAASRAAQTPSRAAASAEHRRAHAATISRLEALMLELPSDLYGTIGQAADWAGLSREHLYTIVPAALGVTAQVEGGVGGPCPAEVDAAAFWSFLSSKAPVQIAGTPISASDILATQPAQGEWLTARQISERLTGTDSRQARTRVDKLIAQAAAPSRPGRRATAETTVYPLREVLYRYLTHLADQAPSDTPLTTVLTTAQMAEDVVAHQGRRNWAIEHQPSLDLPDAALPIDPWLFGVWLGDGATATGQVYVGDDDINDMLPMLRQAWPAAAAIQPHATSSCWTVRFPRPLEGVCTRGHRDSEVRRHGAANHRVCMDCTHNPTDPRTNLSLHTRLRDLGVLGAKHIPATYLRGSHDQRLALLQGLMDADGTISPQGRCELTLSDTRLATDALSLIRTLGIRATMATSPGSYRTAAGDLVSCKDRHRISFSPTQPVFRLPRKAARVAVDSARNPDRVTIAAIDVTDDMAPMRCLYVDAADHLYLAGDFVPTHNTTMIRALCASMPAHEKKVLIEESREIGLGMQPDRHPLVVEMETRDADMNGNGMIDQQKLLRMTLRMDSDRVIIGEVRGPEALQMLSAMTQGQSGSYCTMHADNAAVVFQRLMIYIGYGGVDIPQNDKAELIADAVHFVIHCAKQPVSPGSQKVRRVVTEVIETRGTRDSRVAYNTILKRSREGRYELVNKPSERTMEALLIGGFRFDDWMAALA